MRITIASLDPILAEGLKMALESSGRHEVMEFADHLSPRPLGEPFPPDLVILTEEFHDPAHRLVMRKIKERGIQILLLHGGLDLGDEASEANFMLSRSEGMEKLLELLARIESGFEASVPQSLAPTQSSIALSPRAREIADLVIQGMSNGEISQVLAMSESNVKAHVGRILRKYGCQNRLQLVLKVKASETPPGGR